MPPANLQVFAWGATGPTGSALFTSQTFSRTNATQDFTASNLNLTQRGLYGAAIDNFGYSRQGAAFNLNQTSYAGSAYNLTFQATFNAPSASTNAVPEPRSFLLIGCSPIALFRIRRKRILLLRPFERD